MPAAFAHIASLVLILLIHRPTSSLSAPKMGTSSRAARAALAQLRSTSSKRANLLNVAKCAGWAKREGAAMLFLPECLGFMGDNAQHTLDEADPPIATVMARELPLEMNEFRRALADTIASYSEGPESNAEDQDDNVADTEPITSIVDELRFIAVESKLWISGGGVHTTVPSSDLNANEERKIYNTHVIIDSDGRIKAFYHKVHLFDVSIPGKVNLRESKTTAPGTKLVVCDSPIGKLGVSICYDLRFPEMYVDLLKMDAEVLLVPSAFTVPTGRAHWHTLLQARAIESQCYVLAAAQVGKHNEKRDSYGHSVAYDPWGELVADAGGYDGTGLTGILCESEKAPVRVPSIVVVDVYLDKQAEVRERMPIQMHRENSSFS